MSKQESAKILLTGGAGYIGSHTARLLAQHGHTVVIYDNLSTGHRFLADGLEFIQGDLRDRATLGHALQGMDAVLHFAAHAYVEESVRDPRKYFENNVSAGLTLLSAVVEAQVPHFVFSSSCAVYGLPGEIPIPEKAPRLPINPYGASKLAFEHALEAYGRAYGLRFAILRYFNAAGADESGEIGELHEPETHLIPRALEVASGLRREFEIYGSEYPTADGTCVRDYIHVNDLAEAHRLALNYLLDSETSVAVNLGSGCGSSILEVLSAIEDVTGQVVRRRICSRRAGDPPVLVADSHRAGELLGWKSSHSLHEIVASAWNWMKSGNYATFHKDA